jgi:hypothetical protein
VANVFTSTFANFWLAIDYNRKALKEEAKSAKGNFGN